MSREDQILDWIRLGLRDYAQELTGHKIVLFGSRARRNHKERSDFEKALAQLQDALGLPAENNVIKAGCIQYFEFSFELAWKTIKRIAGYFYADSRWTDSTAL